MSDNPLTLNLSDDLYQQMRDLAEESNRLIEEIALETLHLTFQQNIPLPKPDDLEMYTDVQLWAMVHHRLNWSQSLRLRKLIAKSKDDSISDMEHDEANQMIERNDDLMLLRSKALLLLKQRGQDISDYLRN